MPNYDVPRKPGSIRVPNLDYLSANVCATIRKLTGHDPYELSSDPSRLTALLGWWEVKNRPEYRNITFEQVCDWPVGVFDLIEFDDDADDVREAAQDLTGDDDPDNPALAMINNGGDNEEPPTTGQ